MNITRTLAIAATLSCAALGWSVEIWAPDNLGTTNSGSIGDRIIRFDSANPLGTVTVVGATGVTGIGMSGMDFDSAGNLYAVSGFGTGFTTSNLYSISQTTGAATLIGNTQQVINDLSWNPSTGQLEGVTAAGGVYNISTVNGSSALVGTATGLSGPLVVGMSTNSSGNRFLHDIVSDFMYSLGGGFAATAMGTGVGFNSNFSQGMTMNHAGVGGGADDWYWGSLNGSTLDSQVHLMNSATGAPSSTLATWSTNGGTGLPEYETGDLAINPVPEPATFVALGLGLVGLALARRRK